MRARWAAGAKLLATCVVLALWPTSSSQAEERLAAWSVTAVAGSQDRTSGLLRAWRSYKAQFVSPDGRVIDNANGNISHSEGQGYGMLLAVSADDGLAFSRMWGWSAKELYGRGDGLASWRWDPASQPHVTDPNNATDGDLLIAWALVEAAKRWNSPEYAAASRRIAVAIGRDATFHGRYGLMLKPAAKGFDAADTSDGPLVNLSYWVFPAFPALSEVAPEVDWAALTRSGLALLEASRFGPAGLPSDWISLKDGARPAAAHPPTFGYDAVRVPLYLAWSGLATMANAEPFARLVRDGSAPSLVEVSTGTPSAPFYDRGYSAPLDLVACAIGLASAPLDPEPDAADGYYPASLGLLAATAASERVMRCN